LETAAVPHKPKSEKASSGKIASFPIIERNPSFCNKQSRRCEDISSAEA